MPIIEFQINFPGQLINPRLGHLLTTNTLAEVETAGYLDQYVKSQGFSILTTDFILVAASDGTQLCTVTISNGVITLTPRLS